MRVVVTGAGGLIGHHAAVRLHAANCAARFRGEPPPYEVVTLDHAAFVDDAGLRAALAGAEGVLHFAGVNRASDADLAQGNPDIAARLVAGCASAGACPHVVYANSTHAATDTVYGRSKRIAGEIIAASGMPFTDLVLPHIFGEGARPDYNNVTATFMARTIAGQTPQVDAGGQVQLLHAGEAARLAIDALATGRIGRIAPPGRPVAVPDLLATIRDFHDSYAAGLFPDLSDPFDLALFNSFRATLYPEGYPRPIRRHSDARGTLFEASKGGGGGQTFLSWTRPGVTRGDHFHLDKVERFLVLDGQAVIRVRPVLGHEVRTWRVNGDLPAAIDMPTLHTHSIENVGDTPLLTLFWTSSVFDPAAPDTYADPVMEAA
jgi:UDP-2-acetamido-2,6-beta-L-arabino-hexul-4-ose reductase